MGLFNFSQGSSGGRSGEIKRIVVAGGSRGCGVSFISELIAFGLCKRFSVSLTELGSDFFYNSLGFDTHFIMRGYEDFFEKICEGKRISYDSKNRNMYENISWICKIPGKYEELNSAEIFRSFYLPTEDFNVFDCSGMNKENTMALLAEADFPVYVIDPLPSALMKGSKLTEDVRIKLPNAIIVANKMNPGIFTSDLNRFLGTKNYFCVDLIPGDIIYRSEYTRKPFCIEKQMDKQMEKTQDILCRMFQ